MSVADAPAPGEDAGLLASPRPPRWRRVLGAYVHEGAPAAWGLVLLGLLLETLALPPGPVPVLVLAADVPFLLLLGPASRGRWKRWALLYGALHFMVALRWLGEIHPVQVAATGVFLGPLYLLAGFAIRTLVRRGAPWLLVVPACLVGEEILRTVWLGGMPWPSRSLSFAGWPAFVASAEWFGGYALSLLAALSGATLQRLVLRLAGDPLARRREVAVGLGLVVLVGVGLFALGSANIDDYEARLDSDVVRTTPRVLVAVQGDIPQSLKHSGVPGDLQQMFNRHLDITREALKVEAAAGRPVIAVLWPETMIPWPVVGPRLAAQDPEAWENEIRIVQNVASAASVAAPEPLFLLGAIHVFQRGDEVHDDIYDYGTHDSLLLVDPTLVPSPNLPPPDPPAVGASPPWLLGRHDKRLLVPGGEYTPLGDVLPPLRWFRNLVSEIPELDPGARAQVPFDLGPVDPGGPPIRAATVICFEIAFPARCRELRRQGANVLLNAANYGWFGQSGFRAQIRALAALRAAETRCTVVMAGNTGPTVFFDPVGRPYGTFQALGTGVRGPAGGDETTFVEGWASAPLVREGGASPYLSLGEAPYLVLLALAVLVALLRGLLASRSRLGSTRPGGSRGPNGEKH